MTLGDRSADASDAGTIHYHPTEHLWVIGSGIALGMVLIPHLCNYADLPDNGVWRYTKHTR